MARDKEKSINPATSHLKASKAASIKRSKASIAAQRSARLATRNPRHLENQIQSLKEEKEANGGKLAMGMVRRLEGLERELDAVNKAKAKGGAGAGIGEKRKYDERGGNKRERERGENPNRTALGRDRGRDWGKTIRSRSASSEETDPEVLNIPMPRDTPPPIPSRARHNNRRHQPLQYQGHKLPPRPIPAVPSKRTYESAPVVRDLRAEATRSSLVPAAVLQRRREMEKEKGRLKEPEEIDALEAREEAATRETVVERPDGVGVRKEIHTEEHDDDVAMLMREMEGDDEMLQRDGEEQGVGARVPAIAEEVVKRPKMAMVEDYDSEAD